MDTPVCVRPPSLLTLRPFKRALYLRYWLYQIFPLSRKPFFFEYTSMQLQSRRSRYRHRACWTRVKVTKVLVGDAKFTSWSLTAHLGSWTNLPNIFRVAMPAEPGLALWHRVKISCCPCKHLNPLYYCFASYCSTTIHTSSHVTTCHTCCQPRIMPYILRFVNVCHSIMPTCIYVYFKATISTQI